MNNWRNRDTERYLGLRLGVANMMKTLLSIACFFASAAAATTPEGQEWLAVRPHDDRMLPAKPAPKHSLSFACPWNLRVALVSA